MDNFLKFDLYICINTSMKPKGGGGTFRKEICYRVNTKYLYKFLENNSTHRCLL